MATIEQWLDIETEVERAFGVYLGTTLSLPVVKSDSNTSVVLPRIEIVSTVEEQGPHQFLIASGTYAGRRLYDQFKVSLKLDLMYSPAWNATQVTATRTAAHLRGALRRCLSDFTGLQAVFVTGGLLNLAADSLRQSQGSRSVANEPDKEERLSTTVSAVVFLNTNVVPT